MKKTEVHYVNQQAPRKGRGALSNTGSRLQPQHIAWDDGIEPGTLRTELLAVEARSIISRNQSPDIPFYQSINPYQGCEHGCIYCYARPTHAYHDLSPGIDFETRINYKHNAAVRLRQTLAAPGYQCSPITLGANTDPYQPAEKQLGITRELLEVLVETRHPFNIITKGALIERDLDLIAPMAAEGLASVAVSVTTLNHELKRNLEPRAPSGRARLQAVEALSNAGVPVSVLVAPVIPSLNDSEIEAIVGRAAEAGARNAAYILLRLPLETEALFLAWLAEHYPLKASHIMTLIRDSRGGKHNDSRFGTRMRGEGPIADALSQRFRLCCKKLGLNMGESPELRCDLFRPPLTVPAECADHAGQGDLFE